MPEIQTYLVAKKSHEKLFAPLNPRRVERPSQIDESAIQGQATLWIISHTTRLKEFFLYWQKHRARTRRLLLLEKVADPQREILRELFESVVAKRPGTRLLPANELVEVLASPDRRDLVIGGSIDTGIEACVLYRGDLSRIVAPFSIFRPTGIGTKPSFKDFEVIDSGQTVRLGKYEASVEAILYELDPEFRKRFKRRQLEQDLSIGGSIRRLRLQQGLTLRDFAPSVTEKQLGRIERGETKNPRGKTLVAIASQLGVPVDDLASY